MIYHSTKYERDALKEIEIAKKCTTAESARAYAAVAQAYATLALAAARSEK